MRANCSPSVAAVKRNPMSGGMECSPRHCVQLKKKKKKLKQVAVKYTLCPVQKNR